MKSRKIQILTLIGSCAIASGCGQQAYRADDSSIPSSQTGASGGTTGSTGTSTATGTGTTAPGTTGTIGNNAPNHTFSYRINGTGAYTSPSIQTDSVLKVTVTASAPTNVSGTGWTGMYNCEEVTVTVLGEAQTVTVSRAGYVDNNYNALQYYGSDPCAGAPSSVTLDFSDRLGGGHNTVNVKVSQVSVDNCRQQGWAEVQMAGCPLNVLYSTYSASGNLAIQTNTVN